MSAIIAANSSLHIPEQLTRSGCVASVCRSQQNELERNWLLLHGSEVRCQSGFWHSPPLPSTWVITGLVY